ncbi:hypothetical protein EVAR_12272_1 [Eumeta japonica]|uniref:Mariner Mos1 transposase n=1 Tax=Eumeta variegata TaxID=151549 RepID=A0A4C1TU68_EUMVA|nr:hypothetical protein EVAR_12272_1 [Eumeta japonica]
MIIQKEENRGDYLATRQHRQQNRIFIKKKLLLCIWWYQLDVVYYELLNPSGTNTGTLCRTQLMRLSRALKVERQSAGIRPPAPAAARPGRRQRQNAVKNDDLSTMTIVSLPIYRDSERTGNGCVLFEIRTVTGSGNETARSSRNRIECQDRDRDRERDQGQVKCALEIRATNVT